MVCDIERRVSKVFNLFANFLFVKSEAESKEGNGLKLVGSNRKGGLVGRSENGVTGQVKDLQTWSSRHLTVEVSDSFAATLVSSFTYWCVLEAY